MQFARRFWSAAVCTLTVLVGGSAAQAQNTKILPADTELVMSFNVQQILKSEVLKTEQAKTIVELAKGKIHDSLDEKGVLKYLKKADFDLFRDLSSISIALPGGRGMDEGFILLEGKFDAEKIEAALTEAGKEAGGGVKATRIANVKAFEVAPKEDKSMYVGILNAKTMIACATKADFAEAVARVNGTKAGTFKAGSFKSLLETTSTKQSISFVATSKILGKLAENNPNAGGDQAKMAVAALQQLDGFSVAITVQKDVDVQVGINAKDAESAQKFAGMANAVILIGKAKVAEQAKQNEKLAPLVDVMNSVRANANGTNLVITGQISFDALEKLLQNLPQP